MNKITLATLVSMILAAGPVSAGPTAAEKCESAKNLTASKYASCRQKAEAKLVVSGDTAAYDDATSKCALKFSQKWTDLESSAGGACPTNGDETDIESAVRNHSDSIALSLSGAGGGGNNLIDNGDGTITDEAAGLQWEKKVGFDYSADFNNLHEADSYYRWADVCSLNAAKECQPSAAAAAACQAGAVGSDQSCVQCGAGEGSCDTYGGSTVWQWLVDLNASNFAGHNDWRLPRALEMAALVDFEDATYPTAGVPFHAATCGGSCMDITDPNCSCTYPGAYWASNIYVSTPYMSWYLNFYDGNMSATSQTQNGYVRAVRDL